MKIELTKLAHARSGDKGDTANVGVIALKDEIYPILVREVTEEKVKEHFGEMVKGEVERFELPNLKADGETLQARLDRTRRVPAEEAVRITLDLLEGLACAHARGVLHRDIKPENILLDGEHALLTDFGLARAIGEANYRRLTETGIIVGTVFYMSPEQLREDRSLDQRSDLYSVGCVLYEMLTGEPPYAARSLTEVIGRILKAEVPSVTRLAPSVPPALDEVVRRALAKDAAGRYESAEAFAAALLEVGEG